MSKPSFWLQSGSITLSNLCKLKLHIAGNSLTSPRPTRWYQLDLKSEAHTWPTLSLVAVTLILTQQVALVSCSVLHNCSVPCLVPTTQKQCTASVLLGQWHCCLFSAMCCSRSGIVVSSVRMLEENFNFLLWNVVLHLKKILDV